MTTQYDRVLFHGQPVTARQKQALRAVEKALGMTFTCTQGSWQPATTYSGTTHTKAGVCDLMVPRMDDKTWYRHVLRALREVGHQAAFGRGPWCNMPYHFHTVDLDTTGMDSNAAWQVGQYREGYDGLEAGHKDPFPYRPSPITKWQWQ